MNEKGNTTAKWTIASIRAANERAGWYFFSPETIKFFRSKTLPYVYQGEGGIYFVTSESPDGFFGGSGSTFFSVREFYPDTGRVETVKDAYGLPSKILAKILASGLASRWQKPDPK